MAAATDRKDHLDLFAVTLLTVCCTFWGLQQILIKMTVMEVPPVWQVSIRFWGSTILLLVWCKFRGIRLFENDGTVVAGFFSGLFLAIELAILYVGLQFTNASRQTVLLYIAPFIVAVLLPRFVPAERLHRWQWLGLVIAFSSVVVALSEGLRPSGSGTDQLMGDGMSVMAGVFWGLSLLCIRISSLSKARPEKIMLYQTLVPALVLPLISLWKGELWSLHYSVQAWFSIALQTSVGGFSTFLIWMWILRHYPATLAASFSFLTPVCAFIFGALILNETISGPLMISLLGVTLGILFINRVLPQRR